MQISKITVRRYRSILDDTLDCGRLVALVGANGAGKSAFLRALQLFYESSGYPEADDYFNKDTEFPIEVEVTFSGLSAEAEELFHKYVDGGTLTIVRAIYWNDGRPKATYHGSTLQNVAFDALKAAFSIKDRSHTAKQELATLRSMERYRELPAWTSADAVLNALRLWEADNPEFCERRRDEGQFFGFTEVATGHLGKFTKLIFIPAVREAARDTTEGKSSIFTELLDLVVRSVLASRPEIAALHDEVNKRYLDLIGTDNNPELEQLAAELTAGLRVFVPKAEVGLEWLPPQTLTLPMPTADLKLTEDDYAAPVDRCGHGLQRTFVLVLLQRLVQAKQEATQADKNASSLIPNLVFAIEEPELFQHPNRQRHFAHVLRELSAGHTPGVAETTQVLYATHSPLFVGIERLEDIRLLRKSAMNDGAPKATANVRVRLADVAEELWRANGAVGDPFTAATLAPRLVTLMTPWMNEGFFSSRVVLVEGEDDRAAILGVAQASSIELEAHGISVIPCSGKNGIDRPLLIFRGLGIPVYIVWDSDRGGKDAKPGPNRILLRLLGREPEDWPNFCDSFGTALESTLESALAADIGPERYNAVLEELRGEYGYARIDQAKKNPHVVAELVRRVEADGAVCKMLRRILKQITEQPDVTEAHLQEGESVQTSGELGQLSLGV